MHNELMAKRNEDRCIHLHEVTYYVVKLTEQITAVKQQNAQLQECTYMIFSVV